MNYPEKLRAVMVREGLNQKQIAQITNISEGGISKIVKNKVGSVKQETIDKLHDAFPNDFPLQEIPQNHEDDDTFMRIIKMNVTLTETANRLSENNQKLIHKIGDVIDNIIRTNDFFKEQMVDYYKRSK